MLALLIPLSLFMQTAIFALGRRLVPGSAREAVLKAAVVVGLVAVGLMELLSAFHALASGPMAAAWIIVVLAQAAAAFVSTGRSGGALRAWGSGALARAGAHDAFELCALSAAALAGVLALGVGLLAPPNNFDSMTYHLPRVMHWLQNRSVRFYPSSDLRQLAFPPGAEFFVAQLRLLAGNDRFAAMPQWFAYAGCALGACLLSRRLGAGRGAKTLAVLLVAGLPMAVLQAETTQTDLVTAFWLTCFAVFALKDGDYEPRDFFWLAGSLGLAMFTKPTGLLFGAPLLLVVFARLLRRDPSSELSEDVVARHAAATAFVLLLAALVSAGQLWRNASSLGGLLPEDGRALKADFGLRQTADAALKNAALEAPAPPVWSAVLAVDKHVLGLDPEDPRLNFSPQVTRYLGPLCRRLLAPDEDMAAAPIQFALALWALGALALLAWRGGEDLGSDRAALAAALLLGFGLFCALFKWQEWANRLMLPLFVLGAPLSAQVLEGRLPEAARRALLAALAALAVFDAATAVHRPLVPLPSFISGPWRSGSILRRSREEAFLGGYNQTYAKPFRSILDGIVKDRCGRIGLDLGVNDWEYAWWELLRLESAVPFEIKHVGVANRSADLAPEFPSEELCAVIQTQGGVILYYDAADLAKMHAAGHAEPPRISQLAPEAAPRR